MIKINKQYIRLINHIWEHTLYNSINRVYFYLHFVNNNTIIFYNSLKKKKILILLNKLGISMPYFRPLNIPWFFVNVNISHDGPDIRRYQLLAAIRNKFVKPIIHNVIRNYNSLLPIIRKVPGFFHYMIKWYMSSNRNEHYTFNLNNIVILSEDLRLMLKGWIKNYVKYKDSKNNLFNYFKSLIKILVSISFIVQRINKNKWQKLLFILRKVKNTVIKQIVKLLKYRVMAEDKMLKISNFYMQFFKKFDIIYKRYIDIQNLEIINYAKFSFKWKPKSNNFKNKFLIKNYNYVYFINNIMLKFFIFIFIHWINLHMVLFYNKQQDNINYIYNTNRQQIVMININKHYTEIKYRRKLKKINFLNYFLNSNFILYFRNINLYNNNYIKPFINI